MFKLLKGSKLLCCNTVSSKISKKIASNDCQKNELIKNTFGRNMFCHSV